MNFTDLTQQDTLILGLVALGSLLALAVGLLWLTVAHGRRLTRRLAAAEADFERLRAEVAAVAGVGARVGERLRRLDQVSTQLGERLGQLELRGEGRPYDQAIALVAKGADPERLVDSYGLTRGEADLVARLHGRRKSA
jgi:hypothetical protein